MSRKNSESNNNLRWTKKAKSTTNFTDTIAEDSSKSDSDVEEKLSHKNPFKHLNMYRNTLKGFDNKYTNPFLKNFKPINNVLECSNRNQPTKPLVLNETRSVHLENTIYNTAESWKESISVEKIRIDMLSYMNSMTGRMFPLINLHVIANPFMQVSTEVCRLANRVDLNIAGILCRKRTEAAVFIWMVIKQNQQNVFV